MFFFIGGDCPEETGGNAAYLECLGGFLVRRRPEIDAVDAEYLVAATQLSADIRRTSGQYEGDEDPFAILAADYVEAQAAGSFLKYHSPNLPEKKFKKNYSFRMKTFWTTFYKQRFFSAIKVFGVHRDVPGVS